MTFFEALRAHRGGLLRLKGELYWYGGRGWDGTPGRICPLLDAASAGDVRGAAQAEVVRPPPGDLVVAAVAPALAALLLIDGCPHWIWVANEDVEIIT